MVSESPLLPRVDIKSGATTRTFNPIVGTYDFNLLDLDIDLNVENNKNTIQLHVEDSNADLIGVFSPNDEVTVWVGKTSSDLTNNNNRIFRGFLESIDDQFSTATLVYEMSGVS